MPVPLLPLPLLLLARRRLGPAAGKGQLDDTLRRHRRVVEPAAQHGCTLCVCGVWVCVGAAWGQWEVGACHGQQQQSAFSLSEQQ